MWPPQLQRGCLAIIGNVQPLGAINPISEMQCRWATRVFKGARLQPRFFVFPDIAVVLFCA